MFRFVIAVIARSNFAEFPPIDSVQRAKYPINYVLFGV